MVNGYPETTIIVRVLIPGLLTKRLSLTYSGTIRVLLATLTLSWLFSPLVEEYERNSLTFHMVVEHGLLLASGALLVTGFEKLMVALAQSRSSLISGSSRFLIRNLGALENTVNPYGLLGVLFFSLNLAYWHVPEVFVAATLDEELHALMHTSFVASGSLLLLSFRKMKSNTRFRLLLLFLISMLIYSGILFLIDDPIYHIYSLDDHRLVATVMTGMFVTVLAISSSLTLLKMLYKE